MNFCRKAKLFWAFYFFTANILAVQLFASDKNSSDILIRDYRTYRIYYQGQASILINKKSSKNIIVYEKNRSILTTKTIGGKKIVEYMVPSKQKRHTVVYKFGNNKNPQVGYFATSRKIYFAENEPEVKTLTSNNTSTVCEKPKNRNVDDIKNISKFVLDSNSVNSINIEEGILDPKTCTAKNPDLDSLKETLKDLFSNSGKNLIKCLQSDSAQKKLANDEALLTQASIFVSRIVGYMDEVNVSKINENTALNKFRNNFKIKCESTPKMLGKVACFDDSYENSSMSIDLKKAPKKSDGSIDTQKLQSYVLHEFMHAGVQQPETSGLDPQCLDESIVQSLEGLCGDQKQMISCEKTALESLKPSKGMEAAAIAVAKKNDDARSTQGSTENQIPTATEVSRLANATLLQMTNPAVAANYNEGDKVQVTNPATIRQVSNTFEKLNILSGNAGTVMKAAAAASIGNVAVASTQSPSRSALASTPTVASNPQNTYVPYPPSEIMADKYSPGTENGTISRLANSTLNTNSTLPTTTAGKTENLSSERTNTAFVSKTSGSSNQTITDLSQAAESAAPTDSTRSARKIASVNSSAAQKIQPNNFSETATRSQLVENLVIRKTLSGNDYKEIKKYYIDPNFKTQLSALGISIELKTTNTNQKLRSIGADTNTKIKFIDDGRNLIRQK